MPGPGGSLGTCAICGKSFVVEVMLGRRVHAFSIAQVQGDLFCHDACKTKFGSCKSLLDWPEASPVRRAVLAHNKQFEDKPI